MIVKVILVLINYLMIMPQAEETTPKLTFADFTDKIVRSNGKL